MDAQEITGISASLTHSQLRITSGLLIRKIPAGVQNAPHFRLTFSFRFQRDTPVSGVGTGSLL